MVNVASPGRTLVRSHHSTSFSSSRSSWLMANTICRPSYRLRSVIPASHASSYTRPKRKCGPRSLISPTNRRVSASHMSAVLCTGLGFMIAISVSCLAPCPLAYGKRTLRTAVPQNRLRSDLTEQQPFRVGVVSQNAATPHHSLRARTVTPHDELSYVTQVMNQHGPVPAVSHRPANLPARYVRTALREMGRPYVLPVQRFRARYGREGRPGQMGSPRVRETATADHLIKLAGSGVAHVPSFTQDEASPGRHLSLIGVLAD